MLITQNKLKKTSCLIPRIEYSHYSIRNFKIKRFPSSYLMAADSDTYLLHDDLVALIPVYPVLDLGT